MAQNRGVFLLLTVFAVNNHYRIFENSELIRNLSCQILTKLLPIRFGNHKGTTEGSILAIFGVLRLFSNTGNFSGP